jgi:CheY-like chemotaxis protein
MENETIFGKRILLVDDERVVRESVKSLLARDEHIVVEANNGAEAYSLFAQDRFDLVVTDCVMPFLSGDELAIRIKRLAPRQPILMMTGYGYTYKPGPGNPFDAVLHKPFGYELLQQEVTKLLGDCEATKQ